MWLLLQGYLNDFVFRKPLTTTEELKTKLGRSFKPLSKIHWTTSTKTWRIVYAFYWEREGNSNIFSTEKFTSVMIKTHYIVTEMDKYFKIIAFNFPWSLYHHPVQLFKLNIVMSFSSLICVKNAKAVSNIRFEPVTMRICCNRTAFELYI